MGTGIGAAVSFDYAQASLRGIFNQSFATQSTVGGLSIDAIAQGSGFNDRFYRVDGQATYDLLNLTHAVGGLALSKISLGRAVTTERVLTQSHPDFIGPREFVGPMQPAAETGGVDLALTYKPGWSAAQRAEADLKVQMLTEGDTVVTQSTRSGTSAASRYRSAGNQIAPGNDIDHVIDLQLGGSDTVSNMLPLNSSVNRSLGAQIQHQIKNLPQGTVVNRVTIGD
ncbi:MAG: HNH endonuclease [Sphingomonadales bacterium]|nr:HNH endonuclease [Sphingomonadales bacterium]